MAKDYSKEELAEWFKEKALNASGPAARKVLFGANNRLSDDTFVGKLYVYKYDAKTKATLNMWDKYPLCMVLEKTKDGFLGLNLHYLPSGSRMTFLNAFDKYARDYKLTTGVNSGKGVSNWELLIRSFNTFGLAPLPRACLKRYLFTHIRSRFVEIYPEEFDKAVQLPIDLWEYKR